MLFIDLDNFKGINDGLGHTEGDEVLKQTAARLKQCVPESDTVTRLGGDEFTVILPHITSAREVEAVAEHILAAMAPPFPRLRQRTPRCLELEITESVLIDANDGMGRLFDDLTGMGINFSLDDFGTGYSSLAYLKRYPLQTVKIDRSFIMDLDDDVGSGAIASAIIVMATRWGRASWRKVWRLKRRQSSSRGWAATTTRAIT